MYTILSVGSTNVDIQLSTVMTIASTPYTRHTITHRATSHTKPNWTKPINRAMLVT